MSYGTPALLKSTENWGAFLGFASFCFLALLYVFFMVPDTAGIGVEQIDQIFKGPWFAAYKRTVCLDAIASNEVIRDELGVFERLITLKD